MGVIRVGRGIGRPAGAAFSGGGGGGGGGGTTPNLAALPVLDYQVPDFTAFRAAGMHTASAGASFSDPSSGLTVRKLTDSTFEASYHPVLIYGDCGPHISARYSGVHTIITWNAISGGERFIDYNPTTGVVSNKRNPPSSPAMASNMRCGFSRNPSTPSILYYLTSTNRVVRWDVATNSEAPTTAIPSGGLLCSPSFGVGSEGWLQVAWNGTGDVLCWHDLAASRVYWLDTSTGTLKSRTFTGYNEPHLDKAGRYVYITDTAWTIWDAVADTTSTATTENYVHPCTVNGRQVSHNPDLSTLPTRLLTPSTGLTTTHSTATDAANAHGVHFFANWQQSASDDTQWFFSKAEMAVNDSYAPSSWTLDSGQVYYTTVTLGGTYGETSRRPCNGVFQMNPSDQYEVLYTLTRVTSRVAMVEGTSWWDSVNNRLYVWRVGGGTPGTTIRAWSTFNNAEGIAAARLNATTARKVASGYSLLWNNGADYWERNWSQISVDGLVCVWGSNMGKSLRSTNAPRLDLFAVSIPTG